MRAIMILNEIHVDIARVVIQKDVYQDLSEKIEEVKLMLIDMAYPADNTVILSADNVSHTAVEIPEIDWSRISGQSDGC